MNAAEIAQALQAKKLAKGWIAKCIAHEDKSPSLSIDTGDDGRVLLNCLAGCSFEAVKSALSGKGIELDKTQKYASSFAMAPEKAWEIRDAAGVVVAIHHRVDQVDGTKKVWWSRPDGSSGLPGKASDLPLYGTERLAAHPGAVVFVCEGEKAADAVRKLGFVALGTVTGASSAPSEAPLAALKGCRVCLWPDHDAPGRAHMLKIAEALKAMGVQVRTLSWPEAKEKGDDAADFVARGGTREGLVALMKASKEAVRRGKWLWQGIEGAKAEVERIAKGDVGRRVGTTLSFLDRVIGGGLKPGEMTLLGAATGGGKTSFAQQIALAAAKAGDVLFVTPEMDLATLALREMARRANRPIWDAAAWQPLVVKENARKGLLQAASDLALDHPRVLVLDFGEVTMDDVDAEAATVDDLRLVIVDYAQHVAEDGDDTDRARYRQVGDVARRCVALAKRRDVPVLLCSQIEVATDGKRRKYAFRESKEMEKKAALVIILDVIRGDDQQIESARVILTKHRHGACLSREVEYDAPTFTVRELSKQEPGADEEDDDDKKLF